MDNRIVRKMFLGFISIHILHHAGKEPIYGTWMTDELKRHGYDISAGTLYPILHQLETEGLLLCIPRVVGGKVRKYYSLTERGQAVLEEAQQKARELYREVKE